MSAVDQLVAHTVELDPAEPVDLIAFAGDDGFLFEQEGHGLAGRGVALRLRADEVTDALAAIGGDGAVAVGALPFDDAASGSMVVPEVVLRRDPDGRQTLTSFWHLDPAVDGGIQVSKRGLLPDSFTLTSPRSHREFEATVAEAADAIRQGKLDKVVVAREVRVEANRPIVVPDVLERLRALYPACMVFSADGFVGASPELLVERRGTAVRSHPLAGTYPRSGDPHADEVLAAQLLASVKDQREHRFVIDDICAALQPLCTGDLAVPDGPEIMQLRNVLHLGTEIRGTLRAPLPSALDLALRLHPTPAVGGTPTTAALEWLHDHERLERDRYAGPVGWVDAGGDGLFAVGIRSAEIDGRRARLFAGVGIVEGSVPEDELVETQLKLQALLAAVVRP